MSVRRSGVSMMLGLARWCIGHRRRVVIGWIVIAVLFSVLAQAAGRNYATTFNLPGTESQHALDLLKSEFKAQSGDIDTIVFHTSPGNVFSNAGAARGQAPVRPRGENAARRHGRLAVHHAWRGPGLPRPPHSVCPDLLRQDPEPAAQLDGPTGHQRGQC